MATYSQTAMAINSQTAMAIKSQMVTVSFKIIERDEEKDADRRTAVRCTIYLMLMLALFGWLLFDTWIGNHSLARILGYDLARLNNTGFRLVAFTIIAGGLGGAVDGIRSIIIYGDSFNRRHRWKYISLPWMGSTLALFVYALLRSSMAVLGGSVSSDSVGNTQVLANFAAGALAGFGSKDVFIWLDDKVHKIFQVTEKVPNVKGKPKEVAVSRLQAANLEVGEVSRCNRTTVSLPARSWISRRLQTRQLIVGSQSILLSQPTAMPLTARVFRPRNLRFSLLDDATQRHKLAPSRQRMPRNHCLLTKELSRIQKRQGLSIHSSA